MDVELSSLRLEAAHRRAAAALVVLVAEGFEAGKDALSALIERALASGDLRHKPGSLLASYGVAGVKAERVLLASVQGGQPAAVRKAVAAATSSLRAGPAEAVVFCFAQEPQPGAVQAATLAAAEAAYVYLTTRGKSRAEAQPRLARAVIAVPRAAAVQAEFEQARATALGVEYAREWANRPANHATPTLLAGAAQDLARLRRVQCTVRGPREMARLGMGAFLAVAQGSAEEPRFIELRYNGAAKGTAPIVLVGKGVTFDTGGISLKPPAEMDEMKFDMSGAASVLGVFRALAELQPALNVVGLIAASENMPGGRAVKPGDVVTSMSGQTIEILNTDAEGRLVLCDALAYAERLKPRAVVDIATLTGACVIALGSVRSGMFASSDALAEALLAAGEQALDPCWRMPLDDEYAEGLKSNFADVANVAGRPAGAVTAAKFLQRFAGAFDWAHLDIAGTAWKGGKEKGATGRPVGLLLRYLLGQVPTPAPARRAKPAPARG